MIQHAGTTTAVLRTTLAVVLILLASLLLLFSLSTMALSMTPLPQESAAPGTLTPIVVFMRLSPFGLASVLAAGLCAVVGLVVGVRQLVARRRADGERL